MNNQLAVVHNVMGVNSYLQGKKKRSDNSKLSTDWYRVCEGMYLDKQVYDNQSKPKYEHTSNELSAKPVSLACSGKHGFFLPLLFSLVYLMDHGTHSSYEHTHIIMHI